jgi:hypothetical protein
MSERSPAEKARIRPGTSIAVINGVPAVVESLGLPEDIQFVDVGEAELVLLFTRDRAELMSLMRPAVAQLRAGATLWVFFRKGSSAAGLDMSRNDVWAIAEELGMRPLGLVSVDDTWSAFRLKQG